MCYGRLMKALGFYARHFPYSCLFPIQENWDQCRLGQVGKSQGAIQPDALIGVGTRGKPKLAGPGVPAKAETWTSMHIPGE